MGTKISVQICSNNRQELLKKALHCLFDQSVPKENFEVIVVDDGSTDGTAEMVQNLKPPYDLTFIRQEKEGLAAGRNKGIRRAKGDLVLFIDDDVLADPKLLEEHLKFHEIHPRAIVKGWVNHVSGMQRPESRKWTTKDFSTAIFWTSNVSVKKEYLFEAGLFDEDFKEYGWEDLELGLRLRALGLATYFNPRAVGYHYKRNLKAEDFPALLKQAEAKARTALLFIKKQPIWRAKLSTGIYPLRMAIDTVFSNPIFLSICRRSIPKNGNTFSKWAKFCAHSLVTAHYFETIRQTSKTLGDKSSARKNKFRPMKGF